jgi:HEAT repeat protein
LVIYDTAETWPEEFMWIANRRIFALLLCTLPVCVARADDHNTQTIDPEVQKCIADLSSEKSNGRAIVKLTQLGTRAAAAAPALRKKLSDKNDAIRANAIIALGSLKDRDSIPEMIRMLKNDPSELIKTSAMEAAARFGYGAREVIPAIIRLMGDYYYSEAAFRCFAFMGPQVCDDLQKAWENKRTDPAIRRNTIRAILFFDYTELRHKDSVANSLLKMLDDKVVAADAAEVLTRFDVPRSKPTIALFERKARDGPVDLRVHAAFLLFELDNRNPHVIPALKSALKSDTAPAYAAGYLAKMVIAGSAEAADVLVESLGSPNERIRIECQLALRELGRAFEHVLPKLEKLANDKNLVGHDEATRIILFYEARYGK